MDLKDELLALLLEEEGFELTEGDSIQPRERSDYEPLSYAQQRLWFLDQLEPHSSAYNLFTAARLKGNLHQGALAASFQELVNRHEALRTSFSAVDGLPVQKFAQTAQVPFDYHDLSSHRDAEQVTMRMMREETQRPFDLTCAPLLRLLLLKVEEQEHVLLLTMHHIVSDGWSMGVFLQELIALYKAISAGEPSPLPDLPIQYADFALWQREWLQGEILDTQLSYWKQQLSGELPVLQLPTDRPRPAVQTNRGANESFVIPKRITERLLELSQQEEATLYMTLLAAYQTLLYHYTGQEDSLVGSPIAGRNRVEIEGLIGFFVNTLVFRTDLGHDPTFRELVRRVRQVALSAYEHQDLPFEKLVEQLHPERNLSYNPLFQTMFILQNAPLGAIEMPGLTLEVVEIESETAKFDLSLTFVETEDGLNGKFEYNTDLFDAATVKRMAGHFGHLLEQIVSVPDQHLSELALVTEWERVQLVESWNQTQVDYAEAELCAFEFFEAQVERTPDATALIYQDRELTYRELNEQANQVAHYLRELGVGPDTFVGVCMERSADMIVTVLGIGKAGGAYVALDPNYPEERLAYILNDTQPPVVMTQARVRDKLPAHPAKVIAFDSEWGHIAGYPSDNLPRIVTPDHLVYVVYTSGTTGLPKGIAMLHLALTNMLLWQIEMLHGEAAARTLQFASLNFDVSFQEFFTSLATGGTLVIPEEDVRVDLANLLQFLAKHQVERIFLPFIVFHHLAEVALGAEEVSLCIREIITAGEQLQITPAIDKWLSQLPGCVVHNEYGPSEAHAITVHTLTGSPTEWPTLPPVGRVVPNTDLYLLDSYQRPVPIGVPGEVYVGGKQLARCYLNRPELTAETFVPHLFRNEAGERLYRTGDLARYLADGSLEFLGRIDGQVKVRGFRIELGEIEAVLGQHPSVREQVVIVREDVPGDKRLVAYVSLQAGRDVSTADLRDFLKGKLPEYMVPSGFVVLEALPVTLNGKVDRRALPAVEWSEVDASTFVAPFTEVEQELAQIWSDVLGVERVGRNHHFFEIGGHSLLATQVMSRVTASFEVQISLQKLFEKPTLVELAAYIEEAKGAQHVPVAPPILPVPREREMPVSFAQERMWFFEQLAPGTAAYHMPGAVRLRGVLNTEVLKQSFREIVRRHEALRTTFHAANGQAYQTISASFDLPLTVVDVGHLSVDEQESYVKQMVREEAIRPFDLTTGPLVRNVLFRLNETEHLLVVTMHHIVSDGWSIGVVVRELAALYERIVQGQPSPLPELPVQYADYAVWQRQWLQGEVLERQLAYWKEQLSGDLPLLQLPTDRPRPAQQTFRGASENLCVSSHLMQKVQDLCQREGVTLYMALLAAFKTLLYRYTGQEDILVGSPIAGRNRREIEGLIGFFVNTLVLRDQLDGDMAFRDLLQDVRRTALDAFEHQDLPFEKLVEELQPERNLSYSPVFQTMFMLQNTPQSALNLPGLTMDLVEIDSETAKFDITLLLMEEGDGLTGRLEYNTDLFDAATIKRMLVHFENLLEAVTSDPSQSLSQVPLLTSEERHQLLTEWNATQTPYPQNASIHHVFEQQALQTPEAIALIAGGQSLTYQELNQRANQLAHHLIAQGARQGSLVAVCMERSLEMVISLLGVLKAGAAYVPLDPSHPQERLTFLLQETQVSVLLTQQHVQQQLPSHGAQVVCVDAEWECIAKHSTEHVESGSTADSLAYVIYTSGSTGQPKGVLVPHRGVVRLVKESDYLEFSAEEVFVQLAPITFDAATFEVWGSLLNGAQLVLFPPEQVSLTELGHVLREHRVTTLWLTAGLFHQMVDHHLGELRGVRHLLAGGDVLSVSHVQKVLGELPGIRLINGYGPTENTTFTCCYVMTNESEIGHSVSIGRPIANTEVYVLDDHLQPVPIGVAGELYIGGAGLAHGYLNRLEQTAASFIAHPFTSDAQARLYKTGDIVKYLPDGRLEFIGRADQQVKIRGYRIELGEIESVLGQHPAVREVVVMAREDIPGDKRLVGYVLTDPDQTLSVLELRQYLKSRLPDYMVPSAFLLLENFPLTANGKIDRAALPAPDQTRPTGSAAYTAPRNELEEKLAKIWCDLLRLEQVGVYDNFFEVGGHSLLATQLVSRVRQELAVDVPLRSLFEVATIAELTQVIAQQQVNGSTVEKPTITKRSRAAHHRTSMTQGNNSNDSIR